jgi:hypothetical protein
MPKTISRMEVNEAFFNLGRMAGRLSLDEGKRLAMLAQLIGEYVTQLHEEIDELKNGATFDMDGRC